MKILIILASGIGNSILFGPTLRQLKSQLPDTQIDLMAYRPAFAEPFIGSELINECYCYEGPKTVLQLRKQKYDISITAFPSNKWQFNLFAAGVGAEFRLTHSYSTGRRRTLGFLQNTTCPADQSLHDVDQNLNLLRLLDLKISDDKAVLFHTGKDAEKEASTFLADRQLEGMRLIGAHPGAGPLQQKMAPTEKFVELLEQHADKDTRLLIFGGSEERGTKVALQQHLKMESHLVTAPLKTTAALIKRCEVFVTNDTGLMHIASTSPKTRVIALFNGTNPSRTRPYTDNAEVIVLRENTMTYPFGGTSASVSG
jgi:heptosyltransferase-2